MKCKYKCIKAMRGIPVGAICEVIPNGINGLYYVTYAEDGRSRIMNYALLIQHFEEVVE